MITTNHNVKALIPLLAVILSLIGATSVRAGDEETLPDNPGMRLPFAAADVPRIRIEEAMHYRHPRDYSNHGADQSFRNFREDCGGDGECVKHFADYDRTLAPHKAIDYVDVTGGVFTVYAGVAGKVDKIVTIPSQPYFTSVIVKARIRGRPHFITYTHLDPDTIQLREDDVVRHDTPIGRIYADQDTVWNVDGVSVKGYCRPDSRPHPFPEHPEMRCYPAHLDFQVREIIGDIVTAKDPYRICRAMGEGNYDSCKGYHYPGNRFGTPASPLGVNHLWELAADSSTIRMAVPADAGAPASSDAIAAISLTPVSPEARLDTDRNPFAGELCRPLCEPLLPGHS